MDENLLQAHAYLDRLPAPQVAAVRVLLESMLDLVSPALTGLPFEQEEVFEEFDEALDGEAMEAGLPPPQTPLEDLLAEFGLTMDDWDTNGSTPLPPTVETTNSGSLYPAVPTSTARR